MITVDDSRIPEDHTGDESSRWEEEHGPTFGDPVEAPVTPPKRLPLGDWELYRAEVSCPECGCEHEYVVMHPPIPMLVRGFQFEDRWTDECIRCEAILPVPKDAP